MEKEYIKKNIPNEYLEKYNIKFHDKYFKIKTTKIMHSVEYKKVEEIVNDSIFYILLKTTENYIRLYNKEFISIVSR